MRQASLIERAIQNPHTPEHRALFRNQWLPQVLGAQAAAYTGIADEYVISLHPDIYTHGPNYQQLVTSLAHIEAQLLAENSNLRSLLLDISEEYKNFINFNVEDYAENPDYAYRTCCDYSQLLKIPHYAACINQPFLNAWANSQVDSDGERAIDPLEMIDCFVEVCLAGDVLRSLDSFTDCMRAYAHFRTNMISPR